MNAATDASRLRAGYLPHFAAGRGYRTTLHLINASDKEQIIGVTADGIQTAGQLIPSKTTERTLLPNQFLEVDVATEFGLGGSELTTGYLRWEVPLNTEGVIGFLDYGTADGMLSAIPAQTAMGTNFLASHIAQGSGYYTGLALLNPTANNATVDVSAFSPDGNGIGSTTFSLPAGERRTGLLSELLPQVSQQLGGYVRVNSNQPLFVVQIFGSSDSLRFLANVPAQITGQPMPVPQPAPVGPPA